MVTFRINRRERAVMENIRFSPTGDGGGGPVRAFQVFLFGQDLEYVTSFDTFDEAVEYAQANDAQSPHGYIVLGSNGMGFGTDKAQATIEQQHRKPPAGSGDEQSFSESDYRSEPPKYSANPEVKSLERLARLYARKGKTEELKQVESQIAALANSSRKRKPAVFNLVRETLKGTPAKKVIPIKQTDYLAPGMRADQRKLEKQGPKDKIPDTGHAPMAGKQNTGQVSGKPKYRSSKT